jgi:hypothetical protein
MLQCVRAAERLVRTLPAVLYPLQYYSHSLSSSLHPDSSHCYLALCVSHNSLSSLPSIHHCRGADEEEQSNEVSQIEDLMFVKKEQPGRKADRPINLEDSSVSQDPCMCECGCGLLVYAKGVYVYVREGEREVNPTPYSPSYSNRLHYSMPYCTALCFTALLSVLYCTMLSSTSILAHHITRHNTTLNDQDDDKSNDDDTEGSDLGGFIVPDSDMDSGVDSFQASDSDGSNRRRKKGKSSKGSKGEKKGVPACSSSSSLGDKTEDLTQGGDKGPDRKSPKKVPTPSKKPVGKSEKDEDGGVLTVDDPEEEEAAKAISDLKVCWCDMSVDGPVRVSLTSHTPLSSHSPFPLIHRPPHPISLTLFLNITILKLSPSLSL